MALNRRDKEGEVSDIEQQPLLIENEHIAEYDEIGTPINEL
ncbi:hypothetical protein [Neobacillus dielmonensis]|nr:hypothetical protein [Neobacillus dielmonensis]